MHPQSKNTYRSTIRLISLTLFIGLAFYSNISRAQTYFDYSPKQDSAIKSCIAQLREKGIDTICIYRQYCVGCFIARNPFDTACRHQPYENETYFFWRHDGKTYFTSKNFCFSFDTVQIAGNQLWSMYTANSKTLAEQQVRYFEYMTKYKGKTQIMTTWVDHSEREDMVFIIGKEKRNFHLDEFQFEKYEKDTGININYRYNWNTSLKKLQALLDEIVHINYSKLSTLK